MLSNMNSSNSSPYNSEWGSNSEMTPGVPRDLHMELFGRLSCCQQISLLFSLAAVVVVCNVSDFKHYLYSDCHRFSCFVQIRY